MRCAHQRINICPKVDLVIVDSVTIHGTHAKPSSALCASVTTDGLRNYDQHELTWFLEYPFPRTDMIPQIVTNVTRFVHEMSSNGVFVRAGDTLDITDAGKVASFGSLGDTPDVKGVAFAPLPTHDEYWLGEHEFRRTPYPTLLVTVLSEGERALCGAVGSLSLLFALQMALFQYAPCLPYIPAKRIPGSQADLSTLPIEEGGDLTLLTDAFKALPPAPIRMNGSTVMLRGNMLTLTLPSATATMVSAALAETAAQRTDQAVSLLTDPTTDCATALTAPLEHLEAVLPLQPSLGRTAPGEYSAAGVVLGYYDDEAGVDTFDVVDQGTVNMADADTCNASLRDHALWGVRLRQRSWVRLLDSFASQKGFVCAADSSDGVHFEVRFTEGAELPLFQSQAQHSNTAFQKLKQASLESYGATSPPPPPSSAPENTSSAELLEVSGDQKKVVILSGDSSAAKNLGESDKMKVRMAGGGNVLQETPQELTAPMTASQYAKYCEELSVHKTLAEEVKDAMRRRHEEELEGNIIRIVWTYDEQDASQALRLQEELSLTEQAWSRWKKRLVSTTMLYLESTSVRLPERSDLSPNLCLRILPKDCTGETETVFGILTKDDIVSDTKGLMAALVGDVMLKDCPLSFACDVFVNVAPRGTYSKARRQSTAWEDVDKHAREVSTHTASRLAEVEKAEQRLAERERLLLAREKAVGKVE